MSVSPTSNSYPVLGAAQAAGVDYADALAVASAVNPFERMAIVRRLTRLYGGAKCEAVVYMVRDAQRRGALRW